MFLWHLLLGIYDTGPPNKSNWLGQKWKSEENNGWFSTENGK